MRLLIVGAGVIGTVYGAELGVAGHEISVLAHGRRTDQVAGDGLRAHDVIEDRAVTTAAAVVEAQDVGDFDLVLVCVRRDQLTAACAAVAHGREILFFGNNPAGHGALSGDLSPAARLGFPGIGGSLTDGVAQYARIAQQPTALEVGGEGRLAEVEAALRLRGFAVQRVVDMDGWLVYHAVFVACVSAALYRCNTDPGLLARDGPSLRLMCQAITEGFGALRSQGVSGLPRNLATLHHPLLRAVAVRYWARTMRSPMGELCFAAHARHAQTEMLELGRDVTERIPDHRDTRVLRGLLGENRGAPASDAP